MSMTKTRQKENQDELREIIRSEFPVGTKVKWLIGRNWQQGVVIESALYEWSTDITVRNSRTGSQISKHAKEFELDAP